MGEMVDRDRIVDCLVRKDRSLTEDQIKILSRPSSDVKFGQLCLPSSSVTKGCAMIVLEITPDGGGGFATPTLYYFTYDEWLQFNLVDKKRFRVVRIPNILILHLDTPFPPPSTNSSSASLTPSSSSSSLSSSRENIMRGIQTTPLFLPPLEKQQQQQQQWEHAVDYVSLLFDYIMIRRVVGRHSLLLEGKWLSYVSKQAHTKDYHSLALVFLSSYMKVVSSPGDELLKQWIAFEVYLFVRRGDDEVDTTFITNLEKHLAYVESHDYRRRQQWQHYGWHDYAKWSMGEDSNYIISPRWLFEPEFGGLHGQTHGTLMLGGALHITREVFHNKFLPSLYRHVLLDMVHLCYDVQQLCHTTEYNDFYGNSNAMTIDHLYQIMTKEFTRATITSDQMYDFNVKYAGIFSPIMLDLSQHYEERSKMKERSGDGGAGYQKPAPSSSVDIEDLFRDPGKVMPPCLSRVVTQEWYKSKDRLNLVAYLVDMGYKDREKVVNLMCRNRNNPGDKNIIGGIYDDWVKKKAAKPSHHRVSLPCSSIINSNFDEGNVLRCVYEEKRNGSERTKSGLGDQDVYRSQCSCEGSLKRIKLKSPMNFIEYKANSLASSSPPNVPIIGKTTSSS